MLVALTGCLGCGKSTVLKIFRELGVRTISADEIVHELLESRGVKEEIRRLFGPDVFLKEGKVDRKRLAQRIFSNEREREKLEMLLHPLVFKRIKKEYEKESGRLMVAEIPLLFETNTQDRFSKVITVYAPMEVAIRRLNKRGMTREDIEARLKSQMPIETKLEMSDFVIDNSRGLKDTKKQVQQVLEKLQKSETKA